MNPAASALPAPAAAVFDFDGTLFDASDAICHSLNAALVAHGRAPLARGEILPRIGRPLYEIFQSLEPGASPERVQGLIQAYREAFWPVCVRMTRPLPGLRECLDRLRSAGTRLAIATNRSERGARFILEGFGLGGHFEVIVALEHVTRVKPDPQSILLAVGHLGLAAEQAWMVGDTPDDMRAGRAAGALSIGVTTGAHSDVALREAGAALIVASLAELADRCR